MKRSPACRFPHGGIRLAKSRFLSTFLTLLALVAIAACHSAPSGNSISAGVTGGDEIVNGTVEKASSPFARTTVALKGRKKGFFCSASILSKRLLLTAAHCIDSFDVDGDEIEAGFGINGGMTAAVSIPVDKILVNADYSPLIYDDNCPFGGCERVTPEQAAGTFKAGDLALILLKDDVPSGYEPVRLASQESTPKSATAVGFGLSGLSAKGVPSGAGTLRSMTSALTDLPAAGKFLIKATKQAVCYGDSGGPLMVQDAKGWMQIGVASHMAGMKEGFSCSSKAAAYTSVAAFRTWIAKAQQDILTQKDLLSAPWLRVRTDGARVITNGADWFTPFVQTVAVKCQAPSLDLKANFEIYPFYHSENRYVGDAGEGTGSVQITYEKNSYRFELQTSPVNNRDEVRIQFLLNDITNLWEKTGGRRDRAYAMALGNAPHEIFAGQNGYWFSMNGYQEGAFKIVKSTATRFELEANAAVLNLMDYRAGGDGVTLFKKKARCQMTVDMRAHR